MFNDENGGAKQNSGFGSSAAPTKKRNFAALGHDLKSEFELKDSLENSPAQSNVNSTASVSASKLSKGDLDDSVDAPKKRRPGRRWTQQEDNVLRKLVEKNGNRHWKRIAKEFFELSGSERSDVQCLHRWNKCLKPGLVKGPWSPEEDQKILDMIEECGGPQNVRWSVIAKSLNGRLGKQVRERFINHLDPTISKSEWSTEEDQQLYELHMRLGNRWKWIAELMPGRSENGVKNRWHSIKPSFMAKDGVDSKSKGAQTSQTDAKAVAVAGKTAAAAAVAAAVASASKRTKRATGVVTGATGTKKKRSPTNRTPKRKEKKTESALQIASSVDNLLLLGRSSGMTSPISSSIQEMETSAPMDLVAVAERAKELLRMSESYREMAKLMLSQQQQTSKPSSPQFNDLLQREIANQIAKQVGTTPSVMTNLQGPGNNTASPLATDPVLFSNYYNVFSSNLSSFAPSEKPLSPHQLLAAAAAAVQFAAPEASI